MPMTKPAEPDLFEVPDEKPSRLQITGVLIRDAEVRMKAIGTDDRPMPVLCLDIRVPGPGERTVHAEQAYPAASRFAADAQALRFRAGAQVTVAADPRLMRLNLPLVEEIQLLSNHA